MCFVCVWKKKSSKGIKKEAAPGSLWWLAVAAAVRSARMQSRREKKAKLSLDAGRGERE
jgi:hypothetical protein